MMHLGKLRMENQLVRWSYSLKCRISEHLTCDIQVLETLKIYTFKCLEL